jgi:hypothetical protein
MTAQVIIEISGGIAEAFNRGGSRLSGRELWAFAEDRCGVGGDLVRAQAVLDDMRRLTGHPFYPHEFAEAASAMLFEHWQAVSALAQVLVVRRRIEGAEVEAIIDGSLNFRTRANMLGAGLHGPDHVVRNHLKQWIFLVSALGLEPRTP